MARTPTKIDRYAVQRELGSGGMSVVYLAEDEVLKRNVALKVLRIPPGVKPERHDDFRERFRRESKAAGKLNHPNIVTVFDVGEDDEQPYIAMEFLRGESLRDRIDLSGPLPTEEALEVARQIAAALVFAHERGVVHRDIKPDNLVLSKTGRVKITDFGIARVATSITLSTPGLMVGSPNYMAPEQVKGEQVDGRADIFSLGAVLYEMLIGRKLFEGKTIPEVTYKIVHRPPELQGKFPPRLTALLRRALAKRPAGRFSTAEEMMEALADPLLLTPEATIGDRPEDDRKLKRLAMPKKARAWADVLAGVGAVCSIAGMVIHSGPVAVPFAGTGFALALAGVLSGAGRHGRLMTAGAGIALCTTIANTLWFS